MMTKKKIVKLRCVVCQTMQKNSRYWLCRECAIEWECHKRPYSDWPEWVKALVRIERLDNDRQNRAGVEVETKSPSEMERIVDEKGLILQ